MRKKITDSKITVIENADTKIKNADTKIKNASKKSKTKTEIAAELEEARALIAKMQDPAFLQQQLESARMQAVIDYKNITAKKLELEKIKVEKEGRRQIRLESFKNDKFNKYKTLAEKFYAKAQKYKALAKTQGKLKSTRTGGSNATYDKLTNTIIKTYIESGKMPDSGNYNKRTLDNFKSKYNGILLDENKKYKSAGNATFIKRLVEMQMLEGPFEKYIA